MTLKHQQMDLKTLHRIDRLRRLRSRGPKTPEWLKPYHLLFMAFFTVFIMGAILKLIEQNH
jgi:hypothetical protein